MDLQVVVERKVDGIAEPRRTDRDLDILQALRRREPMAAEHLIMRYGERAYRLASRITGNGEDAEEVVQDALCTIVRKIDTFRGESAFGSWLYRIVANAAYHKLRGRQRRWRELSLDDVLPVFDANGCHAASMADWSSLVNDPAVRAELRAALTSAIDELPAIYRTVLVLRDVEGQSNSEIAATLGLSVPVVKTRVHRARLFLRKRLAQSMPMRDTASITAWAS
jgi:RNA polymerase sigma-70 factor, ECF subfamily